MKKSSIAVKLYLNDHNQQSKHTARDANKTKHRLMPGTDLVTFSKF